MAYEFSEYIIIIGVLFILFLLILVYSIFFHARSRLTYHFIALIAASGCWLLGYTFEIAAIDEATMIFWLKIEYLGIVTIPPLFLLFVLTFTHHTVKPLMGTIFIPSFLHWLALATNESHLLFYQKVTVINDTPFVSLSREYGIIFLSHTIYSYLLLTIGIFLLLQTYIKVKTSNSNAIYQKQLFIMTIGTIILITGNVIRLFKFQPILTFLDLTPIFFLISYILYAYALSGIRFLDLAPFARQFLIDNIEDIGMVSTNTDNLIIDINKSACQYIFEGDCPNIIGSNLFTILESQERLKSYHEKINQIKTGIHTITDEAMQFEMDLYDPEEPRGQFFRLTIKAIRDKRYLLGFIYIIQNISLEKEVELLLRKSIDVKTSLLSVISHDLKNQLMVIQGFTEVLRKELSILANFEELEESLDGIDAKSQQMQDIITDVRSYLKTMGSYEERKQLALIDLKETVNEVISSFETLIKTKNLEIIVKWPEDSSIYTLADIRLRSVINNLLDNAIKWSPLNETVTITINKENHFWICSISDNGPGVPDGIKKEIFKPFVSIGPKGKVGSGLGLSISSEILQSYHSRILIEDIEPRGAKFTFRLPIAKKKES